jgi:hypothetical protein
MQGALDHLPVEDEGEGLRRGEQNLGAAIHCRAA